MPRPGKLFIVGDPKQSIYRFRRADVGDLSDRCCELLEGAWRQVRELTTSFRAMPDDPARGQRRVRAADDRRRASRCRPPTCRLRPSRDSPGDSRAVVALPVPRPYGPRNVTEAAIEKSLPDAVGAFVALADRESGWTVTERSRATARTGAHRASGRATSASCSGASSSFGEDITRPYVEALEARGVPHLLVGGKSFHDREEVETMRAALAAIEWPDDELSVFATLRGALFAIDDELLLEYRHHFGRFHPYPGARRHARPPQLAPVGDALTLLRTLHRRRNYRPVADTIGELLEATRAHVGFVLRPAASRRWPTCCTSPSWRGSTKPRAASRSAASSSACARPRQRSEAAEAPILEEGSDGVRLMTVHKAKGLEFPVVMLADRRASCRRDTADRHIDPDRELCAIRLAGWAPPDLLDHEPLEVARDGRRVTAWPTSRRRARAICSSCRRLATDRLRKAG